MQRIEGINRTGSINPVSPVTAKESSPFIARVNINYEENFSFPETYDIDIGEGSYQNIAASDRKYFSIFIEILLLVVGDGLIVIPTPPKRLGNAVMEAAFRVDEATNKPILQIPIRGITTNMDRNGHTRITLKKQIIEYCDDIFSITSDLEILRLLIVISHEYGHFLSYKRGNHTRQLKKAITLFRSRKFSSNDINQHLWLIFQEESTAWMFAEEILKNFEFKDLDKFNEIKTHSLSSYEELLCLKQTNIRTTLKLSHIPDFYMTPRRRIRLNLRRAGSVNRR
jgi:hypothetical protein